VSAKTHHQAYKLLLTHLDCDATVLRLGLEQAVACQAQAWGVLEQKKWRQRDFGFWSNSD